MTVRRCLRWVLPLCCLVVSVTASSAPAATHQSCENVILVMCDGLRCEEVFSGVDPALINKENGDIDKTDAFRKKWWAGSPEERRRLLMPFLWNTIARQGVIFGNHWANNTVRLANGINVSYPSYSETMTGVADPRIKGNDPIPNPNVSVFEWLNTRPGFRGKVAAIGAWSVLPAILNRERADFYINGGWEPITREPVTPALAVLNQMKRNSPRYWGETEPWDSIVFYSALEYLKVHRPRAFFVMLGETDEWAHEKDYRMYTEAANCADRYLEELWTTIQKMPQYRNKTALLVANDHGRGSTTDTWKGHGKVKGAEYTWIAGLGPGVPAAGEARTSATLTHGQIAATIAALVGEDFHTAVPATFPPIAELCTTPTISARASSCHRRR